MKTYHHFASWALGQPWAVTPQMLHTIQAVLGERVMGRIPSPEEIAARVEAAGGRGRAPGPGGSISGAIAVMPIYGVIMQRMGMLEEISGGTSTEALSRQFRALVTDPSVGTIVLDIDSPGGGVYGVQEFAEEVFLAREQKRVVAVANSLAASAAYWIASAAEEVVVTPGGEVGSIGVYMLHEDWSGAYEAAGVTPTLIRFGDNKGEGLPAIPLDDTAKAHFQERVDAYGRVFVDAVARNRGVSSATVMQDFGQGLVFGSRDAVRFHLADRVETLEQTIERLATGPVGGMKRAIGAVADHQTDSYEDSQIDGLKAIALRDIARARLELARRH